VIKQGQCQHCSTSFNYNGLDRLGKFCSQKCHYDSKKERSRCTICQKEFERRKKDPRKSCSSECFMISRGIKSRIPEFKEVCLKWQADKAGQISFLGKMISKVRRAITIFTTQQKG
jgi:hypothetical protein